MRAITLAATVLVAYAADAMAQQWIYHDRDSNCRLHSKLKNASRIKWTGKCQNGMAHGPGQVTFYGRNNHVIWWAHTGPEHGAEYVNGTLLVRNTGRLIVGVDLHEPCRKRRGLHIGPPKEATAKVFVKTFVEAELVQVRRAIHRIAHSIIANKCNGQPRRRPRIHIYRPARSNEGPGQHFNRYKSPMGWTLVGHAVLRARRGQPPSIQTQGRNAGHRREQEIRQANARVQQQVRQQQALRVRQQRQAVAQQRQKERRRQFAEKQHQLFEAAKGLGATRMMSARKFARNPFQHDTHTIAMVLAPSQVIGRDRVLVQVGLGSALIIRGLPSPTTLQPGIKYLVTVRRPKVVEYGRMPSVASGQYVKSTPCKQLATTVCRDFYLTVPK